MGTSTIAKRNGSIELLRIILLIMLVFYHVLGDELLDYPSFYVIKQITSLPVDVFILITGYYAYGKKTFRIWKYYKWFIFVGIVAFLFYFILKLPFEVSQPNFKFPWDYQFINLFFAGGNWYLISLIIIYGISPFVAPLYSQIKRKWQTLIVVVLFVGTLLTIQNIGKSFLYSESTTSAWLLVMFAIGMWLKGVKYKKTVTTTFLVMGLLLLTTNFSLHFTGNDNIISDTFVFSITHRSLIIPFLAIGIFSIFSWYIKIHWKWLNHSNSYLCLTYPIHFYFISFWNNVLPNTLNEYEKAWLVFLLSTIFSFSISSMLLPVNKQFDKLMLIIENKFKSRSNIKRS